MAKRVIVEIAFTRPGSPADPFDGDDTDPEGSLCLSVCRGVIRNHGGDIRFLTPGESLVRFELELPVSPPPAPPDPQVSSAPRRPARTLTLLLLEPDPAVCRRLLGQLGARGHRAVPVGSSDEALENAQRFRFDAILCSVRVPGLSWVDLFERSKPRLGAFVLLTEGYNSDTNGSVPATEIFVLHKPIEETELDTVLAAVEARLDSPNGALRPTPAARHS
jgi:hypothetical protein